MPTNPKSLGCKTRDNTRREIARTRRFVPNAQSLARPPRSVFRLRSFITLSRRATYMKCSLSRAIGYQDAVSMVARNPRAPGRRRIPSRTAGDGRPHSSVPEAPVEGLSPPKPCFRSYPSSVTERACATLRGSSDHLPLSRCDPPLALLRHQDLGKASKRKTHFCSLQDYHIDPVATAQHTNCAIHLLFETRWRVICGRLDTQSNVMSALPSYSCKSTFNYAQ
jgi:hypothetical protein